MFLLGETMTIYILHATITQTNHQFIELFTTNELLNDFVKAHPELTVRSITLHEVNPI
jgi:succinate dehydrogenase hydrophobic anchor subunit